MHDMGTARPSSTAATARKGRPPGPTLPQWRRTLGLLLGALLVAGAGAMLVAYLRHGGWDRWAAYYLAVAALVAALLLAGQAQQPPRWRAARLLLAAVTVADLLVGSLWIWIAGAADDQASRLQVINLALVLAAPWALMAGLPRPGRVQTVRTRRTPAGRGG